MGGISGTENGVGCSGGGEKGVGDGSCGGFDSGGKLDGIGAKGEVWGAATGGEAEGTPIARHFLKVAFEFRQGSEEMYVWNKTLQPEWT